MSTENLGDQQVLLWVDLETGGLPGRLRGGRLGVEVYPIMEIAVILTDYDLNEIDSYRTAVQPKGLAEISDWALETHRKSGLLKECRGCGVSIELAEANVLAFLEKHGIRAYDRRAQTGAVMAGNNVTFDRQFIQAKMPALNEYVHYRMVDVSSLNLLARRWAPTVAEAVQKKYGHRALDDIRESITELRLYRERFVKSEA